MGTDAAFTSRAWQKLHAAGKRAASWGQLMALTPGVAEPCWGGAAPCNAEQGFLLSVCFLGECDLA